jgi:hypothetical protein
LEARPSGGISGRMNQLVVVGGRTAHLNERG